MLSLRTKCFCTSSTLQRELLRETSVALEAPTIRRVLQSKGYRWLPRCQKPKYSKEDKEQRLEFAEQVLAMTKNEFAAHVAMATSKRPPCNATLS